MIKPLEKFPRFNLMEQTPNLLSLMMIVRNRNSNERDFIFAMDRIFRIEMEECLSFFPHSEIEFKTHTGGECVFKGFQLSVKITGVPIIRSGEIMESAFHAILPFSSIGKLLIQNPVVTEPKLIYCNYPMDIASNYVLLMDPALATGGTAMLAIESLLQHGVKEENIVFMALISVLVGIEMVLKKYPRITIVSCALDEKLNEFKYTVPGIGDVGDRYFRTKNVFGFS